MLCLLLTASPALRTAPLAATKSHVRLASPTMMPYGMNGEAFGSYMNHANEGPYQQGGYGGYPMYPQGFSGTRDGRHNTGTELLSDHSEYHRMRRQGMLGYPAHQSSGYYGAQRTGMHQQGYGMNHYNGGMHSMGSLGQQRSGRYGINRAYGMSQHGGMMNGDGMHMQNYHHPYQMSENAEYHRMRRQGLIYPTQQDGYYGGGRRGMGQGYGMMNQGYGMGY